MILGIESSFNDSAAAVVSGTGAVLSNQVKTFSERYNAASAPIRASEFHAENLPLLIEKALDESKKEIQDIKAIAVTMGPG